MPATNDLIPPVAAPNPAPAAPLPDMADPRQSSSGLPSLSAEQVASARADWLAAGLDPGRFDAALAGQPQAAPATAPVLQDPRTVNGDQSNPWNLTPAQIAEMAELARASGVPEDKIAAAMNEAGFELVDDDRSEAEQEFDAVFAPPPPAASYPISYLELPLPAGADVAALHGELSGLLNAMEMPAAQGAAMAEDFVKDAVAWEGMSEIERRAWDAEQSQILARVVGPENVPAAVANAARMLAKWPDALAIAKGGGFRSARVIAQLHLQAGRQAARADLAHPRVK